MARIFFLFLLLLLLPLHVAKAIQPKSNRIISVDTSMAENNNFDSAFLMAKNIGMQDIGLYQNWNAVETAPNQYDGTMLQIANYYYSTQHTALSLTLTPIHTNQYVMPQDLQGKLMNDPEVIQRYKNLLDYVFSQLPAVELHSIVIGSEFDILFGSNTQRYQEYQTFFQQVSAYIKAQRPSVKVATEATFAGLVGPMKVPLQNINQYADIVGISYYPLFEDATVKDPAIPLTDFPTLIAAYPNKPLYFYQLGYPSSAATNSSELKQSQFIAKVFEAWDLYKENIDLIDFTWLHDMSPQAAQDAANFYGLGTNSAFVQFLATLGFRTWSGSGTDKLAMQTLQNEATNRGFTALSRAVKLSSESAPSAPLTGTAYFYNASTKALVHTQAFTTNKAGQILLNIPLSPQQLMVKVVAAKHLGKTVTLDYAHSVLLPTQLSALYAGDFNSDNTINSIDFSTMNGQWGATNATADLNADGTVNTLDFSFVNQNWQRAGQEP